jgi:purine nucleosidase
VQVETAGKFTSGMTVTELRDVSRPNAQVATGIDADRFWEVVLDAYGSVAARIG